MKYYKVVFENGYPEDEEIGLYIYEDDITEEEIDNELIEDLSVYAEDHVMNVAGYDFYSGWESEEDEADYYDNCSYYKEEITQAEYELLKEEGY